MAKRTRDGFYRRNRFWYTRDPRTGRVISTGREDLGAAKLEKARWEREAADPVHAASARETLADACERVITSLESLGRQTAYHDQKLGHWVRIFGADAKLSRVGTPDAFDEYVRRRRSEHITDARTVSDHTISKEVGIMLYALRLAKRTGRFAGELSILRPLDLSAGYKPRTRALDAAELAALLAELPEHRGAFVALAVGLGLRRSEAFALRPEHVDLTAWVVQVPGTKTAGARRVIPILPPFRGLVAKAAEYLPLPYWPLGTDTRDFRRACRRAGIARCTANDLRRTHATLLQSAGVDRDVTRRLLGHAPKSMMLELVYDQPKPAELAERAGTLDALTRQLSGVESLTGQNRNAFGNAQRHSRPLGPVAKGGFPAGITNSEAPENTRNGGAEDTATRHSPLAWSLAFAAERMGVGRAC